jgi:hypothetical protein
MLRAQHIVPHHPAPAPWALPPAGKVWQRKVLQDLQDETHFSQTELEVLLQVRRQYPLRQLRGTDPALPPAPACRTPRSTS